MKEGSLAAMSTRSRVFSKTTMFFSEYGHRPDVAGAVFWAPKTKFFRMEIFENGDVSYLCTWTGENGVSKTFPFHTL